MRSTATGFKNPRDLAREEPSGELQIHTDEKNYIIEIYGFIDDKLDKIQAAAGLFIEEDADKKSISLSRDKSVFTITEKYLTEKYLDDVKSDRINFMTDSTLHPYDFLRCYTTITAVYFLLESNSQPVSRIDIKNSVWREARSIVGYFNDRNINARLNVMLRRFHTFVGVGERYGSRYQLKGHIKTFHLD